MRFRIEFENGKHCNFANSRDDLLKRLKSMNNEAVTDIRKLYKSGVSDSVIESYKQYLHR